MYFWERRDLITGPPRLHYSTLTNRPQQILLENPPTNFIIKHTFPQCTQRMEAKCGTESEADVFFN